VADKSTLNAADSLRLLKNHENFTAALRFTLSKRCVCLLQKIFILRDRSRFPAHRDEYMKIDDCSLSRIRIAEGRSPCFSRNIRHWLAV
jgi:hypothetical protein